MGTRADYYVGKGEKAEWLGSTAWDGYPDGTPKAIVATQTEAEYRAAVEHLLATDGSATRPSAGWPWPWEDSRTTAYAYTFANNKVWVSPFGRKYMEVGKFAAFSEEASEDYHNGSKEEIFPNMKDRQNVTFGKGSGLILKA